MSVSTYNNIPKHVNTFRVARRAAVGPSVRKMVRSLKPDPPMADAAPFAATSCRRLQAWFR